MTVISQLVLQATKNATETRWTCFEGAGGLEQSCTCARTRQHWMF